MAKSKKSGTRVAKAPQPKKRVAKRVVRGRGDYFTGPLSMRGARLGGAVGAIGDVIVGNGDYRFAKNSLMASGSFVPLPKFNGITRRGVTVREREFLGNVTSSTTFSVGSYPINPGSSLTFPWLSTVARSFEEYEMDGLVFEFVPLSAAWNGTNQGLGVVAMATDYNAANLPFASKAILENQDYAVSSKPDSYVVHGVECAPRERPLGVSYVRAGPVPANSDVKMYDLGNFQIAVDGFSANSVVIGELWVSYDVTFFKKSLIAAGALASFATTGATVDSTHFFGSSTTFASVYGFLPISCDGAKSFRFYTPATTTKAQVDCPIGFYFVRVLYPVGAAAWTGPGIGTLTYTNCGSADWPGPPGTTESYIQNNGTNVANPFFSFIVYVTGKSASVAWTSTITTSGTVAQIAVMQLPTATMPLMP